MGADHAPAGVDVRERVELLAHVLAAAADRRDRLGLGQVEEDALDLLVDVGGEDRERLGGRLVGRERRDRSCPSRAPCAARRSRRRAPRCGPAGPSGSLVELVQRELPAVAGAGQELLQDPERGADRGAPRPRTSRPAAAMCGKPRADRKRSSSSSGFTPGSTLRNAFMISSSPNTIEELDCSTPTGRTSTVPPRPAPAVSAQRKMNSSWPTAARVRAHRVQQLAAGGRVGERVVDGPAVGLVDHRARSSPRRPGAGRAAPGRSRACRPGSAPRPGTARAAATRCAASRRRRSSMLRDLAGLGREPALGHDPLVEDALVEERQVDGA